MEVFNCRQLPSLLLWFHIAQWHVHQCLIDSRCHTSKQIKSVRVGKRRSINIHYRRTWYVCERFLYVAYSEHVDKKKKKYWYVKCDRRRLDASRLCCVSKKSEKTGGIFQLGIVKIDIWKSPRKLWVVDNV